MKKEEKITYRFVELLSLLLFLGGILFYLSWSFLYDTWTDMGVYSIAMPMMIFGILGLLLVREKENNSE